MITRPCGTACGAITMSDDWRKWAECRKHDPEMWWDSDRQRKAQEICVTACPVASECLKAALALGDVPGVWGGLTETARKAWRRLSDVSNAES